MAVVPEGGLMIRLPVAAPGTTGGVVVAPAPQLTVIVCGLAPVCVAVMVDVPAVVQL
jgi:hypothetical protein